jgi:Undecaprenyl-phosphate galactose phosphotransferase WbaP
MRLAAESIPKIDIRVSSVQPLVSSEGASKIGPFSEVNTRFAPAFRWTNALALAAGDILAFAVAGVIGGLLAYAIDLYLLGLPYLAFEGPDLADQVIIFSLVPAALCVWFARTGHYTDRRLFRIDLGDILSALFIGALISGFLDFASKTNFSRLWLVLTWLLSAVTIPLARLFVRWVLNSCGIWVMNAVVIGEGPPCHAVKTLLSRDSYLGYNVISGGPIGSYTGLSKTLIGPRLEMVLRSMEATSVILAPSEEELKYLIDLVDALNVRMIPYKVAPPIDRLPLAGLSTQSFISSDAVLLTIQVGLASPINQAVKRFFDVVSSLVLVTALMPLMLIVAAAVSLDRGPVFFRHERVGRNGRLFKCLKFRTMEPDAEAGLEKYLKQSPEARHEWRANRKLRNDPRTTKLGRMLRSTSIDELPQLINVVRGEMSLIGPRPVEPQELSDYYKDDHSYYLLVRPGITGLWQISGRSNTSYEQRVHLDAWYVRNWSLWNDIIILLQTLPAVIYQIGAR